MVEKQAEQSRWVVLGAAGQLGRELCARRPESIIPLTRAELELTDADAVRSRLSELGPQLVINCAAYNFVDKAEEEPETAFAVNAFAVRTLAQVCHDLDAVLVHFSTDYVFGLDENRRRPYRESDVPGPINVYGESKLAGEHFVRGLCPRHFVIRTCGLYGRRGCGGKGTNFVETMLRLAGEGRVLKVVNDQVLTPSHAGDVADALLRLIETDRYGLYHVTNGGSCSWFEFAQAVFDLAGVKAKLSPGTSREYASKARRPAYSVLESEQAHSPRLRPWHEALQAYLNERAAGP